MVSAVERTKSRILDGAAGAAISGARARRRGDGGEEEGVGDGEEGQREDEARGPSGEEDGRSRNHAELASSTNELWTSHPTSYSA